MQKKLFYNIHNILTIESDIDIGFDYFKVEGINTDPHLVVRVSEMVPVISERYNQITQGMFYSRAEDEMVSFMRIVGVPVYWALKGIMQRKTTLCVNAGYRLFSKYIMPFEISSVHKIESLIRRVLQLKLLQQGATFAIGGVVSFDTRCIVLPGAFGSGKTMTVTNMIQKIGGRYIADDHFIIKDDTLLCFPLPMRQRKINTDFISYSKYVKPEIMFRDAFQTAYTGGSKQVYFLEKSSKPGVTAVSFDEGIEKMLVMVNKATLFFTERMLSFLPYVYPSLSIGTLQEKQRSVFQRAFKGASFSTVSAPKTEAYTELLKNRIGVEK